MGATSGRLCGVALLALGLAPSAMAQGIPAFTVAPITDGGETYTLTIQFLLLMTALTLLPAAVLMMTSFQLLLPVPLLLLPM